MEVFSLAGGGCMSAGQQTELKSFANDDDDDTLDVRADIDRGLRP